MQKGNIGVTTENIFPVIKKFLYSDHEIFLREMVSNAVDATQKLKTLKEQGEFKGELGDLAVQVKLDTDKGTITISDRGIGMTSLVSTTSWRSTRTMPTTSSVISDWASIPRSWYRRRWRSSPSRIRTMPRQ